MSKIIENLTSSKKRSRSPASSTSNTKKSNAAKNSTRVSKPAQAGQFDPTSIKGESTVIYLGHIPTGFGEAESRKFFAQFGKVRRVKIFKSMKTGGSKGYGFVQFETPDVATVVAEAMDGYFLSDRQLVCHVIPVNKLHEGMFLPPKQKSKPVVKDSEGADEKEATDDEDEEEEETAPSQEKIERLTRTQAKKQKRLKDLGIDYDF
jgi:nucleolar protein 15